MHYFRVCLIIFCCASLFCISFSAQAAPSSRHDAVRKNAASSIAQHIRKSFGLSRTYKLEAAVSRRGAKRQSSRSASSFRKYRQADSRRLNTRNSLFGMASWYGADFHGGKTASGLPYDMNSFTAAHKDLPLGTVVKVTEQISGRNVMVCINNRGPYARGRVIDLSSAAADALGMKRRGVAPVRLEVVSTPDGRALHQDEAFFVQWGSDACSFSGPYQQYADASVMWEVLQEEYPQAKIVLLDKKLRDR